METVIITGGTGLVGTALRLALLERGYSAIILARELPKEDPGGNLHFALWDVEEQKIDNTAIAKADHIIHLAGENIAEKRWTVERKRQIVDSRVNGSRLLVNSLRTIPHTVKTLVTASAIGWYGADPINPNPHPFEETAAPDQSFLGNTCRDWEAASDLVTELGVRLVKVRTGIVLSQQGGALKEFVKPMKWGVAAILGNGKQVISWVHIDDLVNIYIKAIEDKSMNGAYNAVSPKPVTNKELTISLAKNRKRFYVPVQIPSFIIRAKLGEMSIEVLKSTTVSCKKILDTGFVFQRPFIEGALRN